MSTCLICQKECKNDRSLATHLQVTHKLKTETYTIQYIYNNDPPKCLICNAPTRYLLFSFKKFCKAHAKEAEKHGGHVGGRNKKTWNKGQTKDTNETIKRQANEMLGKNNHFYGKKHEQETIEYLKVSQRLSKEEFHERINKLRQHFIVLTPYESYLSRQQVLDAQCTKCNNISQKSLSFLERGSLCWFCNKRNDTSKDQRELFELLQSWGVSCEENNKTIISPKHLDIVVPSRNFAIEYNGIFWHQEEKKGKKYHLDKTLACQKQGISLFHVFSDEWINKRDIVESMIKHRLGLTSNKVPARKCSVKEIDNKVANAFLDKTHISGHTKARKSFGLFDKNNKLLSVLTFKKPIQHQKYEKTIEIARYATELNTIVIGGFSKLFACAVKWAKDEGYEKVLTYSDRRFGVGNTYEKNGFVKMGSTPLDYWYASEEEQKRYFRFKFRAQPGKTEKQVAEENNVFKVYGCGSFIWTYDIASIK